MSVSELYSVAKPKGIKNHTLVHKQKLRSLVLSLEKLNIFRNCKCGCGGIIQVERSHNKSTMYLIGHGTKGRKLKPRKSLLEKIEARKARRKKIYWNNRESEIRDKKNWYGKNKVHVKNYNKMIRVEKELKRRISRKQLRFNILMYYSNGVPQCSCCGELEYAFLALDHINNDGAEHRRKVNREAIFRWIVNNNYPKMFQVLCMNCNWAKGILGECPHKTKKQVKVNVNI